MGGDLVSIHSERENGLVFALISAGQGTQDNSKFRPAWIGVENCRDTTSCNGYRSSSALGKTRRSIEIPEYFNWVDETPTPYSNFAPSKKRYHKMYAL